MVYPDETLRPGTARHDDTGAASLPASERSLFSTANLLPSIMRTKIIAVLLAILTTLGGLNLFQSIKNRLTPAEERVVEVRQEKEQHRYTISSSTQSESDVEKRVQVSVAPARSGSDVMIDERFDVSPGGILSVDVSHSDVVVRTGSDSEARIRVTLDGRNMTRARETFEEMDFRAFQEGDRVVLRANDRTSWNSRRTGGADIDVEITIPERFNLDMETSHGDVDLADLQGTVDVHTSHGDIEARTVRGERINIRTSHGDIDAGSFDAREITLRTSHADIELGSVRSERFSATTSHSDVEIENVTGDTEISTSHGDIRVNLTGDAGARFTTSHGDVTVGTNRSLGANLDLRGKQVRVSSTYQLTGSVKKDRVEADINGGGSRIVARTTHGTVTLRPR